MEEILIQTIGVIVGVFDLLLLWAIYWLEKPEW